MSGKRCAINAEFGCITYPRCDGCKSYREPTNEDHIRSMSGEEWVASGKFPCPYMKDEYDECKYGWHEREQTCEECKLDWLKQPYKEDV